tara:strand:- start:757 stop:1728 length:972 start_codon:yes stop_codon:yes gene_type:complete
MEKVLITGGAGFIGMNLALYLIKLGYIVSITDSKIPRCDKLIPFFRQVDLLEIDNLKDYFNEMSPEYVVHLGARTDLDGETLLDYSANTSGVYNVIAAINSTPSVKKTIFASSRLVCKLGYKPSDENDYLPTTAYGESKVEFEKIIKTSKIDCDWCIVRPTSIWGPWFGIPYRTFFDTVRRGYYIHPLGAEVEKLFGFVGNSVFQIEKLLLANTNQMHKKVFYLADYECINVLSFAKKIRKSFGLKDFILQLPLNILKMMALAGDLLKMFGVKNPPLTSFRLENLKTNMNFDMNNIIEVVGPDLPFTLDDAVNETVTWIKHNG